jgi:late competence protein required for DNA uptake (superfamily II DNA/RNA helicase)
MRKNNALKKVFVLANHKSTADKFKYYHLTLKNMAGADFGGNIKVNCKRCGKPAAASEFVLDPYYRMMVCPACVKERREGKRKESEAEKEAEKKIEEQKKAEEETASRPPGWDEEDVYLEKALKAKQNMKILVKRVDENKVRYMCKKCGFTFNYNLRTEMPRVCQYCAAPVNKNFEIE